VLVNNGEPCLVLQVHRDCRHHCKEKVVFLEYLGICLWTQKVGHSFGRNSPSHWSPIIKAILIKKLWSSLASFGAVFTPKTSVITFEGS